MSDKDQKAETLNVFIPFKRETLSELMSIDQAEWNGATFSFPSNGKYFLNWIWIDGNTKPVKFSFPSNGKYFPNYNTWENEAGEKRRFSFPSNGKYFPNSGYLEAYYYVFSFPFPSNGKHFPNNEAPITTVRAELVFIPFKRETLSELFINDVTSEIPHAKFSFPSNGKHFPNNKVL